MAAGRVRQHRRRAGREARSRPRAGRADDPTARPAAGHAARPSTPSGFSTGWPSFGIRITAVFGGFEGESYADIPTVTRTVGLVPPATRAARTKEMKEIADFARLLGVRRRGAAPGLRAARRQRSALSRGAGRHARPVRPLPQPTARTCTWKPDRSRPTRCCSSSATCERDNLFINFDPANMILYGSGEPIEALEKVGRYVQQRPLQGRQVGRQPGAGVGQRSRRWAKATSAWKTTSARSTRSATTAR